MATVTKPIEPNKGPQTRALASPADILIFGGAASGGKSYQLLMEPIRHLENPGFRALIFRRTYQMIEEQGSLWDTSCEIYPFLWGRNNQSRHKWTFPSGASVRFAHLQHEKDKIGYQGSELCMIGFDELTHFSSSQFWYIISRSRSSCEIPTFIRCTCNPEPGWVAEFVSWWIDQETGYPIPERDGVLRWFYRHEDSDEFLWYDTKEEAMYYNPLEKDDPLSVSFIASKLEDNPKADPRYGAKLRALPRIERLRLKDGNWKVSEESILSAHWTNYSWELPDQTVWRHGGTTYETNVFERFAIIDTAGTSKQKAAVKRGKAPSWSCAGIFDHHSGSECKLVRAVWRTRVGWNELKEGLHLFLKKWGVQTLVIENAHFGPALYEEMQGSFRCHLIGPVLEGMEGRLGAKLERAVASRMLLAYELGEFVFPAQGPQKEGSQWEDPQWKTDMLAGIMAWTGLDDEVADWIDVLSYASEFTKTRRRRARVSG